jgi:hypothetical protein
VGACASIDLSFYGFRLLTMTCHPEAFSLSFVFPDMPFPLVSSIIHCCSSQNQPVHQTFIMSPRTAPPVIQIHVKSKLEVW